jgi:hypothetical protein
MKTIKVNINCNETTCGNCDCLGFIESVPEGTYDQPSCNVFLKDLDGCTDTEQEAYRCKACLDAEVV